MNSNQLNLSRRLRRLLALSGLALAWERLWRAACPIVAVLAGFAGLALTDVLPHLPGWLHVLILVAFVAGLIAALRYFIRSWQRPEVLAAQHRLERDNGLPHRPLTALDDELASGGSDPMARALWRAHQERMARLLSTLRVSAPSPGVARHDPRAYRAIAVLCLGVGLFAGYQQAPERFARAFTPNLWSQAKAPVTVDLWITPPAYTRVAPRFLEWGRDKAETSTSIGSPTTAQPSGPIIVPAGSTILAQVNGPTVPPRLVAGDSTIEFEPMGGASYRAETSIVSGHVVAIQEGDVGVATWPIQVVPDYAPEIAFDGTPEGNDRNHLMIRYTAKDDYGIANLEAVIRRVDGGVGPAGRSEIRISVPVPRHKPDGVKGRTIRDLTADTWAGLPVYIKLVATDQADQIAESTEVELTLPERAFRHPVAQAIIGERKKLSVPTDTIEETVAEGLGRIMSYPQMFSHDSVVFLALSVARSRLTQDRSEGAIESVQEILWDTALRVEEGTVSIAERNLRRIEDRLREAMQQDRYSPDVERLLDELQRALDEYLQALMEQLQNDGMVMDEMPPEMQMQTTTRNDLQEMIERARELARTGNMDAAREMLAELQRRMQNMRAAMAPHNGNQQANQQMQKMQQMMQQMRDLAARQQELLDQTFRQSQQGQQGQLDMETLRRLQEQLRRMQQGMQQGQQGRQGQQGQSGQQGQQGQSKQPGQMGQGGQPGDMQALTEMQSALRRMLGELMLQMSEMLGNIPPNMGNAERAMRDAADALGAGQPGQAMPSMAEALEQLRQGQQAAAQQMMQAMQQMRGGGLMGMRPGERRNGPMPNRDPFGREPDGAYGSAVDGDLTIPAEGEVQRAKEILDELRYRAGQRNRPRIEREYLERLIEMF